jgi:Ca2+-binding RTX toxin-like protein
MVVMLAALVVGSGVAWAAQISCPNRAGNLCVGTNNKDTMTGRDRADEMRAKDGADEMRGRGGADELLGQDGPDTLGGGLGKDTLSGAKGEDRLAGAEGDDALNGGDADDTYVFNTNKWGNDTITDTTNLDPGTVSGTDTGNFAQFGSTDQFLITNLTINLTSSAGSPEVVSKDVVSTGTITGTVNWSNNAIDSVYVGSITDDTINGNATANTIVSNIGPDSDDTITAGAGNDWISVLDGAGGDTVNCGEGTDKVFSDTGDMLIDC